jgi:hypothetical protein
MNINFSFNKTNIYKKYKIKHNIIMHISKNIALKTLKIVLKKTKILQICKIKFHFEIPGT